MTLMVADPRKSQEFYQGLFGLPVQARQGDSVILRIGAGPQYVALSKGNKPGIAHFCMTVENFNVERIMKTLAEYGVTRTDSAATGTTESWVRKRAEGAEELYLRILMESWCSSRTPATAAVRAASATSVPQSRNRAPNKGLIAARDFSHFTLMVADPQRSRDFYQSVFGLRIQAYQGSMPVLGVGARGQFLVFAGGAAAPNIGHACLNMEGFDPDKVLRTLSTRFGPVPKSYVTMRMEDRGGARDGTPELYFTDPDGILMQLQDVSYCGGAGYPRRSVPGSRLVHMRR